MNDNAENRAPNASLAGLLRIEDSADEWSERDLEALWRHQLGTTLADQFGPGAPAGDSASTFGELFQGEKPSLEHLQQAKRFAKSENGLPLEVAGVLYLVAIAAARTQLGERITETPDEKLVQKLQWASSRSWLDGATRELLENAEKSISGQ